MQYTCWGLIALKVSRWYLSSCLSTSAISSSSSMSSFLPFCLSEQKLIPLLYFSLILTLIRKYTLWYHSYASDNILTYYSDNILIPHCLNSILASVHCSKHYLFGWILFSLLFKLLFSTVHFERYFNFRIFAGWRILFRQPQKLVSDDVKSYSVLTVCLTYLSF